MTTTGPLKAKIQLATESDYQHLLSNLASNSQQLQRVFTQQDFVIDGRNHELWNAGLTVIIRYSKEEVLAGSPRSDSDRQGCSIVLKETIFFGVDSGKPYFEVREKEERATLDNGEIKQILLGANVSTQSQSSILRDVISKYPVEGGIRCIGSFKNFRHVFVWDNVLIEVDRCSFPHGEGFFCRFDVDEAIIIKVLNYLQSTGITYCINITSKTALFFQGLNELAVTSQTNASNNWLPLEGVMGGSSPGSIMTAPSPPAPLEPRTLAGMSAVNTNSIWTTAPFTVGGLPAADIILPGIVTKPPTTSSVNAILIGNTPPLPTPMSVSSAGIPPPMTLPSVPSQISQSHSHTALNRVSPSGPRLSASPSLDGFKPPSSIIVLDQTDTAERSSGGGPLRTNGGPHSGSKLGGGTKVNGPAAPKGGSMSDGAPEEEESAEMQKRRNREASARYRRKKQVEYEQLSVKVSEHERTIQLLRERVRQLEGENAALKLRIGVAPAASLNGMDGATNSAQTDDQLEFKFQTGQ